eukprot:gene5536-8918_t
MAIRRLQKEMRDIQSDPIPGFWFESSDEDCFHWKAAFEGPANSPYEGGIFRLDIRIPERYPFVAPKMQFITKIFHPNVCTGGGICLVILESNWSSSLSIQKVVLSICSLLTDPNPHSPLNWTAAKLYRNHCAKYEETVSEWTKQYAI